MNERSKKVVVVCICIAFFMLASFGAGVVYARWRIKGDYSSAVAELTDRISELEATNLSLERANSELAETNQKLEETNIRIQGILSELGGSLGRAESLSGETETTVGQLEYSLTGAEEASDKIIEYLVKLAELCGSAGE